DQAHAAKALGVSRQAISSWEQGHTEPSATNFVRLARLYGQPLEWFAAGVNAETAPAEAGAVSSLSQHSVRLEGLEPPTFCFGDTAPFWTVERSAVLASLWCQVETDSEIPTREGVGR